MSSSTRLLSGKQLSRRLKIEVGEVYNIVNGISDHDTHQKAVKVIVEAFELHGWKFLLKETPPVNTYVEVIGSSALGIRCKGIAKLKHSLDNDIALSHNWDISLLAEDPNEEPLGSFSFWKPIETTSASIPLTL